MPKYDLAPAPKPVGFNSAIFNEDSQHIAQQARQLAIAYNYKYVATHHLLYALLEHNFVIDDKMFGSLNLPMYDIKMAMLRTDPPEESTVRSKNLPTFPTRSTWCCYIHAIEMAKTELRLVTPPDLFAGLKRNRESSVDIILAEHGIGISLAFNLHFIANSRPGNAG